MEAAEKERTLGEDFRRRGDPGRARQHYIRALARYEALDCRSQARDLCLTLADLAMEEGNMHEADVWYVRAMGLRNQEGLT